MADVIFPGYVDVKETGPVVTYGRKKAQIGSIYLGIISIIGKLEHIK